ncbi:MAG: SMP-30/gluconolactonase/LRE family protein [Dehalococcoidia bacterium]|nr:SMP-30/gluconolactonase/LRE family protein [Dehalococcoidia bacterium]
MTSTEWPEQAPGSPGGGSSGSRWSTGLKIGILLLILIALGWVLLITGQYCSTGKPISELPGVPGPVDDLFDSSSFTYVSSIEGLNNPMGVAVGLDGKVYVTETGGAHKIHIYDSLGTQELGSFSSPGSDTADRVPMYVAVNPDGDVYVSDRGASKLFIFSPDGTPKGEVAPPEGTENWHPLGLTFDQAGNLYVADVTLGKHRVLVMDPAGKLKLSFGTQGEEEGQFSYPNGIAVDGQGRIFVTDSNNGRMQAFDKDGKFLFLISRGMSKGDLAMPRGIAIDTKGRLLIVDTTRASIQAYKVSDSGGADANGTSVEFKGVFYGDLDRRISFQFPNGMALDGHNKVYIADRGNNRVSIWEY